jgi:hypothetical protein
MFAGIHPLRCKVIVPGMHAVIKYALANTRNIVLGTPKYEHRRPPLYHLDGPYSRLILGLPLLSYILLDNIAYVFYLQL